MNKPKVLMNKQYVRVAEESDGEEIGIPTEQDGTVFLSCVSCTSLLTMIDFFCFL